MRWILIAVVTALLGACGAHSAGGMSGPSMSNSMNDEPPPPEIQSNDILAREQVASKVKVKHILIGFKGLDEAYGGHQDPRGAARSREDADALAVKLLGRVRAGETMEALMAEFSEDPGSAQTGDAYPVTADAQLVFEFKRLSLRLNVGEAGLVLSAYGWHVVKRVE